MNQLNFSTPNESMDHLRGLWSKEMRDVPEARHPHATHSGWPLGLLPVTLTALRRGFLHGRWRIQRGLRYGLDDEPSPERL